MNPSRCSRLNFTPTRQAESFDEVSAWNETGGDSLTFSESNLMRAQRGLRLAVTLWPRSTLRLPATVTRHFRTTGDRLSMDVLVISGSPESVSSSTRAHLQLEQDPDSGKPHRLMCSLEGLRLVSHHVCDVDDSFNVPDQWELHCSCTAESQPPLCERTA